MATHHFDYKFVGLSFPPHLCSLACSFVFSLRNQRLDTEMLGRGTAGPSLFSLQEEVVSFPALTVVM